MTSSSKKSDSPYAFVKRDQRKTELEGLRRSLQTTGRILYHKDMVVKFSDDVRGLPACSTKKELVINLGRIEDPLSNKGLATILGLTYHEIAHMLYSPKNLMELRYHIPAGTTEPKFFHKAYVFLEEARVETLYASRYPRVRNWLTYPVTKFLIDDRNAWDTAFLLLHGRRYIPAHIRKMFHDIFKKHPNSHAADFARMIDEYRVLSLTKAEGLSKAASVIVKFALLMEKTGLFPPDDGLHNGQPQTGGEASTVRRQDADAEHAAQQARQEASEDEDDQEEPEEPSEPSETPQEPSEPEDDSAEEEPDDPGTEEEPEEEEDDDSGDDGGDELPDESPDAQGDASEDEGADEAESDPEHEEDGGGGSDSEEERSGDQDGDSEAEGRPADEDRMGGEDSGQDGDDSSGGVSKSGQESPVEDLDDEFTEEQISEALANLVSEVLDNKEALEELRNVRSSMKDQASLTSQLSPSRGHGKAPVTADMMAKSGQVADVLRQIWAQMEPGWQYGVSEGSRLDMNRAALAREPEDYDYIYDDWQDGQQDNAGMEVVILVDESSSMGSKVGGGYLGTGERYSEVVSKNLWELRNALQEIEAVVTVLTFNAMCHTLYNRGDTVETAQYIVLQAVGGTNPDEAIKEARRILNNSEMPNRLLIVQTDGEWGHATSWDPEGYVGYGDSLSSMEGVYRLAILVGNMGKFDYEEHFHTVARTSGDILEPMSRTVVQMMENIGK